MTVMQITCVQVVPPALPASSASAPPAEGRGRPRLEFSPAHCVGAGLEMASRAASIEHDNKIGRIGAYHLFRLPIAEEAAVHDLAERVYGVAATH